MIDSTRNPGISAGDVKAIRQLIDELDDDTFARLAALAEAGEIAPEAAAHILAARSVRAAIDRAPSLGIDPALQGTPAGDEAEAAVTAGLIAAVILTADGESAGLCTAIAVGQAAEQFSPLPARRRIKAWVHREIHREIRRARPRQATPRRPATRSRAPRRPRGSASSTTSSADPPGDDGGDPDSDPDLDPVERRVRQLVSQAPPLSAAQSQLLARVLGGAR